MAFIILDQAKMLCPPTNVIESVTPAKDRIAIKAILVVYSAMLVTINMVLRGEKGAVWRWGKRETIIHRSVLHCPTPE